RNQVLQLKQILGADANDQKAKYQQLFAQAMSDDLNTSEALAVMWQMLDSDLSAKAKLELLLAFDRVFGLGLSAVQEDKISIADELIELAEKRRAAKEQKDFQKADELRRQIEEQGFSIEDTKEDYTIKKF